jgi:integrase
MRDIPEFTIDFIPNRRNLYILWSEGGRSFRRSTGTEDRGEAQQVFAGFLTGYKPADERVAKLNLAETLDLYQKAKSNGTRQDSTLRGTVERLKAHFGRTDPHDIGLVKQEGFITARRKQGVSDATIKRDLSVLSAALNYAAARELIDPPKPITSIAAAQPRERYLTRGEAKRILQYLHRYVWWHRRYHHVLLFARIALRTGQRAGVISSLTWDRVDFEVRNLHMEIPGRVRTKKRQITIGFNHYLERALKAERRRQLREAEAMGRPAPTHVLSFEGQPVKNVRKAFTKACVDLGILDTSPNTLRHTFGTWAARNSGKTKISLYDIAGAMAHSNIATTQRYAKHMPEAHIKVVESASKK